MAYRNKHSNLDAIAVVGKNNNIIKVLSDDFDIAPIDLNDLEIKKDEIGTSEALIRGVCSRLKELGFPFLKSSFIIVALIII